MDSPDVDLRVVSLLPAGTEWMYALGLGRHVAGVTFECDEPATARRDHPVVLTGWDTSGLTSGQIDAEVRRRAVAGEPTTRLDAAAVRDIAPHLVICQDLCAVCALPAGRLHEAMASVGCRTEPLALSPRRLPEVLDGALAVAAACGVPDRGRRLRAQLQARLTEVADAVAGRARPRVLMLEWADPPFTSGHWVPDLVHAAGGVDVMGVSGGRSRDTAWDSLLPADSQVEGETFDAVVVAPCGYGVEQASAEAERLLPRLPAGVPVWAIDADAVITRPGPRVVQGVRALAAALHPGAVAAPADLVRRVG